MNPISTQLCIFIERKIERLEKKIIEQKFELELYSHKICLREKEYLIDNVFDISYRNATEEVGFLYLHTNEGVIPTLTKTDPKPFIESFRKVKQS